MKVYKDYNSKDQNDRIKDLNIEKTKSEYAYEKTVILAKKTAKCYNGIESLVKNEIEKEKTLEEAIKIVSENKSLEKIYPQIKDELVKRKVFNTIRTTMYNKEKKQRKIDDGEIEL